MAQKPVQMDYLKDILRLHQQNIPIREIARRLGLSRNSVRKYLRVLPADNLISDKELASIAYKDETQQEAIIRYEKLLLHFSQHARELSKTGVTRRLLWTEYLIKEDEGGYGYSQYCYHLKRWLRKSDLAMHMEYTPGDLIMCDYAGDKLSYVDRQTGQVIACNVFVSVLPYSGYTFCISSHTQNSSDMGININAMSRYYGGMGTTILFDNTKTLVIKSDRYEPTLTGLCHQLSAHYQTTFTATRPYAPRDKAMVEKAVNIVYNHIYGPLRNKIFYSLDQLNAAIMEQLNILNDKPYKNTPYSRRYYFEQMEKELLHPLPTEPYRPKKMVVVTVQRNYHVQIREHNRYYSVPYAYVGQKVTVYYDKRSVEVYCDHARIAIHHGVAYTKMYYTKTEHMPPNHQAMEQRKGWSKEGLLNQARRLGESIEQAAQLILESNFLVEQNYKSCYGMMMLANKYTTTRLEAACKRALRGTRVNYTMIKNILERGLDKIIPEEISSPIPLHDNIRGSEHYQ
jgi:transposase